MNEKVLVERKVESFIQALKYILIAVVILSVGGGAYLFVKKKQDKRNELAFEKLFEAEKIERDLGDVANPFDPKFYEALESMEPTKLTTYKENLEKVVGLYPDTIAGDLARLRLARLSARAQDLEGARSILEALLKESQATDTRTAASYFLGQVLEDQNKNEDALKIYDNALSSKDNAWKPELYLSKARVLKSLQKTEEAKVVYEKVISEFPNSIFEKQARVLMAIGG